MFNIDLAKKYGIMLSGGLDSAILLGLFLKNYPTINIQPFTIPKHDGASLYANNIIDYLNKKFKTNIPQTIYVGNPDAHHRLQSTTAVIEIFDLYPLDFLFIGLNKNPPELETLNGAPTRETRSPHPKIVLPFVNLYKDKVLEFAFNNDLEDLIEITHSCTERQTTRCGQCWQCTERSWAFTQLNKLDTGTH